MANNKSTTMQTRDLNWMKGTTYAAAPATVYIALFTTQPANDGTGGVEESGVSYARQALTTSTGWSAISGATPSQISNNGIINFGTAGAGGWGTLTSVGIYDASSGGNLLYVSALTANKTVNAGDSFTFPVGNIVIQSD